MRTGAQRDARRPALRAGRRVGGRARVDGEELAVDPGPLARHRDRSWGIRPVGEAEPPGRAAADPIEGFWWMYVPLRFDDFAVVVIVQEEPDGYRTLNDALRVWPREATRAAWRPSATPRWLRRSTARAPAIPTGATVTATNPDGTPLVVELESLGHVALSAGCGSAPIPSGPIVEVARAVAAARAARALRVGGGAHRPAGEPHRRVLLAAPLKPALAISASMVATISVCFAPGSWRRSALASVTLPSGLVMAAAAARITARASSPSAAAGSGGGGASISTTDGSLHASQLRRRRDCRSR